MVFLSENKIGVPDTRINNDYSNVSKFMKTKSKHIAVRKHEKRKKRKD